MEFRYADGKAVPKNWSMPPLSCQANSADTPLRIANAAARRQQPGQKESSYKRIENTTAAPVEPDNVFATIPRIFINCDIMSKPNMRPS